MICSARSPTMSVKDSSERAADLEHDAALRLRGEAGRARRHVPLAGSQRRKKESALAVRHPLYCRAGGGVPGHDGRPLEHSAIAVFDDAANLACIGLRLQRTHPPARGRRRRALSATPASRLRKTTVLA